MDEDNIDILQEQFAVDVWFRSMSQNKIDTETNAAALQPLANALGVL
jgi:hypothetical protein